MSRLAHKLRRAVFSPPSGAANLSFVFNSQLDVSGDITTTESTAMYSDGSGFIVHDSNSKQFVEFTMSTPYDVSTGSPSGGVLDLSGVASLTGGLCIRGGDSEIIWFNRGDATVYRYTLNTPKLLADGATQTGAFDLSAYPNLFGFHIAEDGLSFCGVSVASQVVTRYTMPTPFDVDLATFDSDTTVASLVSVVLSTGFINNGAIFYYVTNANTETGLYDTGSPYGSAALTFVKTQDLPPLTILNSHASGSVFFGHDAGGSNILRCYDIVVS